MKSSNVSVLLLLLACGSHVQSYAAVSSNSGSDPSSGFSINSFVGADVFYGNGYSGNRSIIANIEGGHVWNQASSLTHVQTFLDGRGVYQQYGYEAGALGQFDRHATWVGSILAGRGNAEYQKGIAFGATLWSGAIATDWSGQAPTRSFGWSRGHAFTEPYATALLSGVNGRRADVVNSSWGGGGDLVGSNVFSLALDGIAKSSGRTVVFSAGNNGPSQNSIGWPQSGYNNISVGALGNDLNQYRQIASFSSRSPSDYSGPDGFFPNARARIDLVAPGENITTGAFYGGTTGGNRGGVDPTNGATDWYTWNLQGTSFAAPIVAAGAALLNDVAYDRFSGNESSHNGQVIKAVLLNSARKTETWNNGQIVDTSGAIRTTQALDYVYGAGALDLQRAFVQFTTGTTDLLSSSPSSLVAATGWDYGEVLENGRSDYLLDGWVQGGSRVTATLNWHVGRTWSGNLAGGTILASDDYFTNLALQLYRLDGAADLVLVAESNADFLNTEHFSIDAPESGRYLLRVNWMGERYDLVNHSKQDYGLAWSVSAAVPELGTPLLTLAGLIGLLAVRSRRRGCAGRSEIVFEVRQPAIHGN